MKIMNNYFTARTNIDTPVKQNSTLGGGKTRLQRGCTE